MRYTRLDGCRAWLTYGQFRAERLTEILQDYGSAEYVYDEFIGGHEDVLEPYASAEQLAMLREHAKPDAMHEMMVTMQTHEMRIMSIDDFIYPDSLRDIPDPPPLLFYRGNPDCLLGKCITIIGTRTPSQTALAATDRIAYELSRHGVHIVSGLAVGVDTAAHQGCINGGTTTIGVMACGLDVNYPVGNKKIRNSVLNTGGIILSEYPPGTPALGWHFPIRNRILAGLGKAVVLVEAKIQSGSMTTVNHALSQGKEVFAYPGNIGTFWAEGSHQLLREGANYFTSAQDILEDMGWDQDAPAPAKEEKEALPPLTDEQRVVFSHLSQGEKSFDQLCAETGLEPSVLSGALTMLQILGMIKSLPGKTYIRV